jgi:hypothetical protein
MAARMKCEAEKRETFCFEKEHKKKYLRDLRKRRGVKEQDLDRDLN